METELQTNELEILNTYSNTTKNICMCTSLSIILILVFIISPLSNFLMLSFIGKIAVLVILGYSLYKNVEVTNVFSQNKNMFSGNWNPSKTNIVCSYVFSIFIFILLISVLFRLF